MAESTILTTITADPWQRHEHTLSDGSSFILELRYYDIPLGWFYSLFYKNYVLPINRQLVVGSNILSLYTEFLPFGIAVNGGANLPSAPLEIGDLVTGDFTIEIFEKDYIELQSQI